MPLDERAHRQDDHRWAPVATEALKGLMSPADKQALSAASSEVASLTLTVASLQARLVQLEAALAHHGIMV
jgi:hypothetical protein